MPVLARYWRRVLGEPWLVAVAAIDYPDCARVVAELQSGGMAAKTVRNIRDVLRLIFKLAVRWGALKSNPVEDVPVGEARADGVPRARADHGTRP